MGVLWVGLGVSRVGLEGGFSSISSVMIAIDVGSELCGGNNWGLRSRSKISGESGDHHDTLLKWDCGTLGMSPPETLRFNALPLL